MIGKLIVVIIGALLLSIGLAWMWAFYFPSNPQNNVIFGVLLIPFSTISFFLWLWFCDWQQRWMRLIMPATLIWSSVAFAYYYGG